VGSRFGGKDWINIYFLLIETNKSILLQNEIIKKMHLTYNAINSQYAVTQSLPIWGDLEG
jgi:hypothetical protein